MVLSPDSLSGWRLFEEGSDRYCGHDFIGFLADIKKCWFEATRVFVGTVVAFFVKLL
jgi:hypothetical protein